MRISTETLISALRTGAGIYKLFEESQDIERQLNAANDRIKRLEEAGDALCVTMQRESKYLHGENFKASIELWNKAKEDKQ